MPLYHTMSHFVVQLTHCIAFHCIVQYIAQHQNLRQYQIQYNSQTQYSSPIQYGIPRSQTGNSSISQLCIKVQVMMIIMVIVVEC